MHCKKNLRLQSKRRDQGTGTLVRLGLLGVRPLQNNATAILDKLEFSHWVRPTVPLTALGGQQQLTVHSGRTGH